MGIRNYTGEKKIEWLKKSELEGDEMLQEKSSKQRMIINHVNLASGENYEVENWMSKTLNWEHLILRFDLIREKIGISPAQL